jgi:hypothetical protein
MPYNISSFLMISAPAPLAANAAAARPWLSVDRRGFYVRYYLSTASGEGTRPVVFLCDHFGTVRNW